MEYEDFLKTKIINHKNYGFSNGYKINSKLFDFQREIVKWALRKGKSAIFADCGLGKTFMQLEWARIIHERTNQPVLILAPLAVSIQTKEEGLKLDLNVNIIQNQSDIINGINITNYEKLHKINTNVFSGIVLDESSILKSFTGKVRGEIIENFRNTKYKLACTATPSPNDYMELGNHCEFLDIMTRVEMLSMYFIHDSGETSKWRLKGHAQNKFWEFIANWAIMISNPSELGYKDNKYILPGIKFINFTVRNNNKNADMLIALPAVTLDERRKCRKLSIHDRVERVVEIVGSNPDEQFLIWCDYNIEGQLLNKRLKDSVEVSGSTIFEKREDYLLGFAHKKYKILITKPKIAGFGMNFQNCANMIFCGLSDSYEQFYQATRRIWRFGQERNVKIYIVIDDGSFTVLSNIKRKESDFQQMQKEMLKHILKFNNLSINEYKMEYKTNTDKTDKYTLILGDSVEEIKRIEDESIDYSIFSPPFASLYTYSNSERDMGNCKDNNEFYEHFEFIIEELLRITLTGRLLSFHCMNLPSSITRDGVIGIKDFRGELIRLFIKNGWIYHSEVVIWKDPVVAMQRTKALGLLNKQKNKDSAMSRMGIPDYVVTMRKPGVNIKPIKHNNTEFPISQWQKIASPIWMDINQSDTLSFREARDINDEKHICPLQLEVIERCLLLWSNPGDLIFSPFMGIGSEGYQALRMNRRFFGIELKESYYKQAKKNLSNVDIQIPLTSLKKE